MQEVKDVDERRLLNSWKEIAAYVGRGVRTVQRYELELALPVRRPAGTSRSSVMAFSDELDAWLNSAPARANIARVIEASATTSNISEQNTANENVAHVCPRCMGTGRISDTGNHQGGASLSASSR
jgi:hypothetical protein